jgi:fructan beta-fructosidase
VTHWVLKVDTNPGGRYGGSGSRYLIGDFDGVRFTPLTGGFQWVDYGADFYAAASFSNLPSAGARHVWLAWMNNWAYAGVLPTGPWRGAMTLPREVGLLRVSQGYVLTQQPAAELSALRESPRVELADAPISADCTFLDEAAGDSLEIRLAFEPGTAREVGLLIRRGPAEQTRVGYDAVRNTVFVDRSGAGYSLLREALPARHEAPLAPDDAGQIVLTIFVDRSSVEVFSGDGRVAITDVLLASKDSRGTQLYAEGGTARLRSLQAWPMRQILR